MKNYKRLLISNDTKKDQKYQSIIKNYREFLLRNTKKYFIKVQLKIRRAILKNN